MESYRNRYAKLVEAFASYVSNDLDAAGAGYVLDALEQAGCTMDLLREMAYRGFLTKKQQQ